jgi:hypothetical protein
MENRALIIQHVRACNFLTTACAAAGISVAVLRRWRERGQEELEQLDIAMEEGRAELADMTPHAQFFLDLVRAEAEAEIKMTGYWVAAAEKNWQAAERFLTKRFPRRWADAKQHVGIDFDGMMAIENKEGKPFQIMQPPATSEAASAMIAALVNAGAININPEQQPEATDGDEDDELDDPTRDYGDPGRPEDSDDFDSVSY